MRRLLAWSRVAALLGLALIVLLLGSLALIGVPAPPAIDHRGLPRIKWRYAFGAMELVRRTFEFTVPLAWDPAGGLYVQRTTLSGPRLFHITEPGAPLRRVPGLDAQPGFVVPDSSHRGRLIVGRVLGGSERADLGVLDPVSGTFQLVESTVARVNSVRLSPDGRQLLWVSPARNGADLDVYVKEVDADDPVRLFPMEGEYRAGEWSSDGSRVLLFQLTSMNQTRLHLLDPEDGRVRGLGGALSEPAEIAAGVWAPDGAVAYLATDHGGDRVRPFRLDVRTGELSPLEVPERGDVQSLVATADGRYLLYREVEGGVAALRVLDLETDVVRTVPMPAHFPAGPENLVQHPSRPEAAFAARGADFTICVYSYDAAADVLHRWTECHDDGAPDPRPEAVLYPTFDFVGGAPRTIPAFVLPAPAQFPRPTPVVIDIHGGPAMQADPWLSPPNRMLWSLGATIILPNVRGSTGYGAEYARLDDGFGREGAIRDISALLDWIATRPDLDADRVAVAGGSYGGFLSLSTAVRESHRLRCVVDLFGIADLPTFLEESKDEHYPEVQRAEYGDVRDPATREYLASISPLSRADEMAIPLFVYQGLNDPRVKPAQSRRIVDAVRANGGEVWHLEAGNEGHAIADPLNQLFVGAAGLQFMATCLGLDDKAVQAALQSEG